MNKSELIAALAEKQAISKVAAAERVEAVLDCMAGGIVASGLQLAGFGNFAIKHRAERKGRNPTTGAEITIAAKNVVDFNPSAALKAAVNA